MSSEVRKSYLKHGFKEGFSKEDVDWQQNTEVDPKGFMEINDSRRLIV